MRYRNIPADTSVLPNTATVSIDKGANAVLLLHGWTGWTGRLLPLGERLANAGFTVRIPRLPGHGTNVQDFVSSTANDWLRRAIDEFIELRTRADSVYVAGTSMGAALTVIISAMFDVPRVALLAPALMMRNPFVCLSPVLKYVLPRVGKNWDPDQDPDPMARVIGAQYGEDNHVSAIAELYHIRQRARRALRRLNAATLVIASKSDETVPPSVAPYIMHRIPAVTKRSMVLERSGHQMVQGVEGDFVCSEVVKWFTA